eukprot:18210-Pleurochrysis_carterae.AAC.1
MDWGSPAGRCKRVLLTEVSGPDTPVDLYRLFLILELGGGRVGRQKLPVDRYDRQGHRLVIDRAPVDD